MPKNISLPMMETIDFDENDVGLTAPSHRSKTRPQWNHWIRNNLVMSLEPGATLSATNNHRKSRAPAYQRAIVAQLWLQTEDDYAVVPEEVCNSQSTTTMRVPYFNITAAKNGDAAQGGHDLAVVTGSFA